MGKFDGQHFAILGAGRSGLGAARLARLHGAKATIFDEGDPAKIKTAEFPSVLGDSAKSLFVRPGEYDLAIISPGLDAGWPLPKKFTDAGVPLTGEMEFGFSLTDMPMVGITGTNGKSTCTELVAALFNGAGRRSIPCGNHGLALSELVAGGEHYDVLSLEISSFQLETISTLRTKVAVWLNFAPDHLDRYPDVEAYYKAKARIFENQTPDDYAVIRAGENVGQIKAKRVTFSSETDADFTCRGGKFFHAQQQIGDAARVKLRGRHNMENILAALAAGWLMGLSFDGMMRTLESYEAPRHRCELVLVLRDREYINDSKATNLHALESCIRSQDRPIVLIAGGKEKGLNYTPLRQTIPGRVHAMVLIGEIAQSLERGFGDLVTCRRAADMNEAVRVATELSRAGDAIVLSPGTSSFDMYTGYAQRGDVFCAAARALV
ncbi:MAG: UDP-N-acetylmuramoyl-L-alanine--D-glutamate ligase [Verrucomicrobiaceae bacterium]|nr:UDP-N-acetylmuramoyl-L-alanine--D-glutamate ligase [Verrucomicrobiaceae bacterium]